jgi:hypothetical protein
MRLQEQTGFIEFVPNDGFTITAEDDIGDSSAEDDTGDSREEETSRNPLTLNLAYRPPVRVENVTTYDPHRGPGKNIEQAKAKCTRAKYRSDPDARREQLTTGEETNNASMSHVSASEYALDKDGLVICAMDEYKYLQRKYESVGAKPVQEFISERVATFGSVSITSEHLEDDEGYYAEAMEEILDDDHMEELKDQLCFAVRQEYFPSCMRLTLPLGCTWGWLADSCQTGVPNTQPMLLRSSNDGIVTLLYDMYDSVSTAEVLRAKGNKHAKHLRIDIANDQAYVTVTDQPIANTKVNYTWLLGGDMAQHEEGFHGKTVLETYLRGPFQKAVNLAESVFRHVLLGYVPDHSVDVGDALRKEGSRMRGMGFITHNLIKDKVDGTGTCQYLHEIPITVVETRKEVDTGEDIVVGQYDAWAKSITWVKQTGVWSVTIDPTKDLGARLTKKAKNPTRDTPIQRARDALLRGAELLPELLLDTVQMLTPEGQGFDGSSDVTDGAEE